MFNTAVKGSDASFLSGHLYSLMNFGFVYTLDHKRNKVEIVNRDLHLTDVIQLKQSCGYT